jgi:[ribosomal protein S5]-alanine N-acetyltransferase
MSRRILQLETERLLIRELVMEDLEAINDVLNHCFGTGMLRDERQRWLEWTVLGHEMFAMLEQPHYGERAVVSKETGAIAGVVGIVPYIDTFNRVDSFNRPPTALASAEVGLFWGVDPAHQGKGFATEAAGALMRYLFVHERLGRIIATTGYDNVPSQKVMQKLGMTVQHLEEPQAPDQFVVGARENNVPGNA